MTERVRVAVGVLTYQRPEMLAGLLPILLGQVEALPEPLSGQVLIVDNDPAGSAETVARRHDKVVYVHEPTPGIAAARARAVSEATQRRFDLLQFLDDDERPSSDWLATMVGAWSDHGHPAAVAGAVVAAFETPPSDWIEAGGFFVRRRHATGTSLPAAPAGNLLLDLAQVEALGVQFDDGLGLRGGEDTLFTRQLVASGGRIIFCDEAPIVDQVPADRATREWVLRRSWHHGGTHSFVTLRGTPAGFGRAWTRVGLVAGGAARAASGAAKALVGAVIRNPARNAKGWRLAYRGAGIVAGAVAGTPPEYSRTEGNR